MSVRPHPQKPHTWILEWWPEGRKGGRRKLTLHECDEATARLTEQNLRRRRHGGIRNAVNPIINAVLPEWLEWMRLHRAPKTLQSIGWALKHLQPHFGPLTVPQIHEGTINQYQHKRRATPRSCNLEIDYLKSLISWMAERKLCDPLPFKIRRLPYHKPLPRIPSPEDLMRWMDAITPDGPWDPKTRRHREGPKKALLWIMLRCGLRFQEATKLRWEDIDFGQGAIYIQNAKGGKPRLAILPQEAAEILEPIRQTSGWIAPGPTGEPLTHMKTLFKTASEKSEVPIKGPHTLRHICGTYTLAATGDLRLVQATLGHTQIRTTELYTQIDIERLRSGQAKTRRYTRTSENKKKK